MMACGDRKVTAAALRRKWLEAAPDRGAHAFKAVRLWRGAIIFRQGHHPKRQRGGEFLLKAACGLFRSQMISVEPPPISKISAPLYLRPIRGAQPSAARSASSSAEMTLRADARFAPGAARSGCRHWRPAAPPGWRWRAHGAPMLGDVLGADFQGGDGAVHGGVGEQAGAATPSPSRTMREKESTARKRVPPGRRGGRSAGGNCWCPDPAPPAAERRSPAFAVSGDFGVPVHLRAISGGRRARRKLARPGLALGRGKSAENPILQGLGLQGAACQGGLAGLNGRSRRAPRPIGGSSNGRTPDFDSGCLGSNPSPPATQSI